MTNRIIFITGGTGYVGKSLIPILINNGFQIKALVRPGSENKLTDNVEIITGNALEEKSFINKIKPAETFIQLVGISHPNPMKAKQFREIDLVSAKASIEAASKTGIKHFIYISVAHPAPIMKEYIEVRKETENFISEKKINATLIRPWYILGENHYWPYVFLPAYWLLKKIPATRETAKRLEPVRLEHILKVLLLAVQFPAAGVRVIEAPQIKNINKAKYFENPFPL
jgi:uncharacterized protein YbjT (DUF2867 family)